MTDRTHPDSGAISNTADEEATYTLTPYGLLGQVIDADDAKAAIDALTLYMLRHAKPGHVMGLVVDGGYLQFVQVIQGEPT